MIELDDSTHDRAVNRKRDADKDAALDADRLGNKFVDLRKNL